MLMCKNDDFYEPSLPAKHLRMYDLILLYNNFIRYKEFGARFPFCN